MEEKKEAVSPADARLSRLSGELAEAEGETRERLEGYYYQLAQEADGKAEQSQPLHEEVRREVRALKEAALQLRKGAQNAAAMADELEVRLKQAENRGKKIRWRRAPANAAIDLEEQESEHFARGINLYKLLLVCFIGSFAGVVVEILWCLVWNGYIESRSGLVYGPFNLLYGIGAVVLTVALYQYRNRSSAISFFGGMIVGSAVEYVCSWGQELAFGSRSWDYSAMPFNLNGRICLEYAIFWGVLGVLWIKSVYPRMAKLILRLPNRPGKIITWLTVAFLIINSVVTLAAVTRWSQRLQGEEPSNAVEEFIDQRFPDERMERIFANMEFGSQS